AADVRALAQSGHDRRQAGCVAASSRPRTRAGLAARSQMIRGLFTSIFDNRRGWNPDVDSRAARWSGVDTDCSAQDAQTLLHADEAEASLLLNGCWIKPPSRILDSEANAVCLAGHANLPGTGIAVFGDVAESFLDDPEETE